MPSDIVETAQKGVAISAPVGADPRTAASVRVPFQSVGDRLKWLEEVVTRLFGPSATVNASGSLVPGASLVLDLSNGRLDIVGDDDHNINLGGLNGSPGGVQFFANGLMAAHLFTEGRTGRANRKVTTRTVSGTIDPRLQDQVIFSAHAAAVELTIQAQTYVSGDHFRVSNYALGTTWTVTVKNPGGTTLAVVPTHGLNNRPGWGDFCFDGTNWLCTATNA